MKLTDRGEKLVVTVLCLLTGIVLFAAGWVGQEWKQDRLRSDSEQATCQEDEACWNCETMGNGVCG